MPYIAPVDFMIQQTNGLSAIGPPWSKLTAYDLNTGTILWQIPNGEVSRARAPASPGPAATRRAAAWSQRAAACCSSARRRIASSARTTPTPARCCGYELPAATEGVPAVYSVDGRQYVAIAVGGNGLFSQSIKLPAGRARASTWCSRSAKSRR